MRYKLIAFDMDGTLTEEDSCWGVLHRHFGTQEAARRHLKAYDRGEIDYPEFMRRDIALWKPVPTLEQVKRVLTPYRLAPNVERVVPMALVTPPPPKVKLWYGSPTARTAM